MTISLENISFAHPNPNYFKESKIVLTGITNHIFKNYDGLALFGANGSGKSTFLKGLFTDEVEIQAGSVEYNVEGKIYEKSQILQSSLINVSFADFDYPVLPVKSVIKLLISLDKRIVYQTVVKYLKEFGQSDQFLNQPINLLSQGQKKKIQLSIIFSKWSYYNIIDEVLANLDATSVLYCKKTIRQLLSDNKSKVIIISHNYTDVLFLETWGFLVKDEKFLKLCKLSDLRKFKYYSYKRESELFELQNYNQLGDMWIITPANTTIENTSLIRRDLTEGLGKIVDYYYINGKLPELVMEICE